MEMRSLLVLKEMADMWIQLVILVTSESNMSNVVPSSPFQWLTKKHQCQLLNHLGYHNNMEKNNQSQFFSILGYAKNMDKKNGVHVSKRWCSKGYCNG